MEGPTYATLQDGGARQGVGGQRWRISHAHAWAALLRRGRLQIVAYGPAAWCICLAQVCRLTGHGHDVARQALRAGKCARQRTALVGRHLLLRRLADAHVLPDAA